MIPLYDGLHRPALQG